MGWGDEGKGSIIEALTRQLGAKLVVRHNGGAQAGHNVVLSDGRSHCFSQFGAGTLAGARTHLSKFMIVNPIALLNEAHALTHLGVRSPLADMTIHEDALVTTPWHIALNRMTEASRADSRHGSCGMGVGETVLMSISHGNYGTLRVRDLANPGALRQQVSRIREVAAHEMMTRGLEFFIENFSPIARDRFVDACSEIVRIGGARIVDDDWLAREIEQPAQVIFEGAQGVLLDQDWGFAPHTTWSDCTFRNVDRLVNGKVPVRRLGVFRAFGTRHGAGPFPTESARFAPFVADDHNVAGPWQGAFRAGAFDLVLAQYALSVVGRLDGLCVTCVDRVTSSSIDICRAYKEARPSCSTVLALEKPEELDVVCQQETGKWLQTVQPLYWNVETSRAPGIISSSLSVPLAVISRGPMAHQKEIL